MSATHFPIMVWRVLAPVLFSASLMLSGCFSGDDDAVADPPGQQARELARSQGLDGNPVGSHVIPTPDDPRFQLGRALFFSSKLSGSGDISCGACHMPQLGGADGLSLAVGVDSVFPEVAGPGRVQDIADSLDPRTDGGPNMPRNVTTLFNIGLINKAHFWDGRVFTLGDGHAPNGANAPINTPDAPFESADSRAGDSMLQALVLFPVITLVEMRGFSAFPGLERQDYRDTLAQRIGHHGEFASLGPSPWLPLFQRAFGPGNAEQLITYSNITRAIEAYIQAQTFVDTPWKAFLAGNDDAMSAAAQRGAKLFFASAAEGGANCSACHTGDLFTDEAFHILAVPQIGRGGGEAQQDDFGRYAVSKVETDRYAFRTPPLLNVAVTAPYGHAGAHSTLEAIIRHHLDPAAAIDGYDFDNLSSLPQFQGLGVSYRNAERNTRRALAALQRVADPKLVVPLRLSDAQVADLVAFLDEGLTDPCVRDMECMAFVVPDPADGPDDSIMDVGFSTFEQGLAKRPPALVRPQVGPDASVPLGPVAAACEPVRRVPASEANWHFSEEGGALGFLPASRTRLPFPLNNDFQLLELLNFSGGVAPVDINDDCRLDLYFATPFTGPNRLYVADDAGGYVERAADYGLDLVGGYSSVAFADLDGDGDDDLLAGKVRDGAPELWLRVGNQFVKSPESEAFSAKRSSYGFGVGDIDNDNDLDVFAAYWDFPQLAPDNYLWLNNGDGTFEPGDEYYGIAAAFQPFNSAFAPGFMDYNGDSLLDMLLVADQRQTKLFRNVGGESLENVTDPDVITDTNGMGSAIADFDGDGDADWFVTSIDASVSSLPWTADGNRLYRNDGGTFVDATDEAGVRNGAWGWGACAADFNNDGHIDIFHTNGFGVWDTALMAQLTVSSSQINAFASLYPGFNYTPNRLFLNNGNGTFTEQAGLLGVNGNEPGLGVVCFDSENDGDVDIVVHPSSGAPTFYRNNAAGMANANFVTLVLRGRYPNAKAIGAKVEITAGGRTQTRWVTHNSNHNSHNPLWVHVGLGGASRVSLVRITWPTGVVSTVSNLAGNAFHAIDQP